MKKILLLFVLILVFSTYQTVYATEGNLDTELFIKNKNHTIGQKFPVIFLIRTPMNHTFYDLIFLGNNSEGLLCSENLSWTLKSLQPNKTLVGNWSCAGRKLGYNNVSVELIFTDSNNQTHSNNHTTKIQILPCQEDNCTIPLWIIGKDIGCADSIDTTLLSGVLDNDSISYKLPILKYKKPPPYYQDLVHVIRSFTVDILSLDSIRITYEFYIEPLNGYIGEKTLNELVYLNYKNKYRIKNLKINDEYEGIIKEDFISVCHFESKYCACQGDFYEPQIFSHLDVSGGLLDYQFEIKKAYKITFDVEKAFEKENNSYFSKFGIFVPVGRTEFYDGVINFKDEFESSADLLIWKKRWNKSKENPISFTVKRGFDQYLNVISDNVLEEKFRLKKENNKLRYIPKSLGSFTIIDDYSLLEYEIELREKEESIETVEPTTTTPTTTIPPITTPPPITTSPPIKRSKWEIIWTHIKNFSVIGGFLFFILTMGGWIKRKEVLDLLRKISNFFISLFLRLLREIKNFNKDSNEK